MNVRVLQASLLVLVSVSAVATAAVGVDALDHDLLRLVRTHDLSGDPASKLEIPDIHSPKAQLGMRLFFSRSLSGNRDIACASCHHPLLGGGDGLSLPIGSGVENPETLGAGRALKGNAAPVVARNAPTTFNAALWKWGMFHDSRIELLLDGAAGKSGTSPYNNKPLGGAGITTPDVPYPRSDHWAGKDLVQAQARFPLTFEEEMRGHDFSAGANTSAYRSKLVQRLGGYDPTGNNLPQQVTDYWQKAFRDVYGTADVPISTLITEQNVSELLSIYERSQLFVNNPWNRYVKGDTNAISTEAKQGALLFFRQPGSGGFGCANCHRSDTFTDEGFHNMLMPPIGPGKQADGSDGGRGDITQQPQDKYAFRTPSLLNVAVTGPWGHNGAYTSLEGMVKHMLSPHQSASAYDSAQLQQANIQTEHTAENLKSVMAASHDLPEYQYTETDVQQLVAFLKTLTDPCVQDAKCLQPWIPQDAEPDLLHFEITPQKTLPVAYKDAASGG